MPQFDPDRAEVIQRAWDSGVELILAIGTGKPQGSSIERTLDLAERHDRIWAAIGVSPHDARLVDESYWDRLETWAGHPKVVLWGEIGLDYHYDLSPRDIQYEVFRRQLRLAREHRLPVSIHCRDAWKDVFAIVRDEYAGASRGGVLHSFTGAPEEAREGVSLGFLISFSGIVTFKNAGSLRETAFDLPLDRLAVETDCPYLAPAPHRGVRNEPAFVLDTARLLAQIKNVDFPTLARETSANVRRLLDLPPGAQGDSRPEV